MNEDFIFDSNLFEWKDGTGFTDATTLKLSLDDPSKLKTIQLAVKSDRTGRIKYFEWQHSDRECLMYKSAHFEYGNPVQLVIYKC